MDSGGAFLGVSVARFRGGFRRKKGPGIDQLRRPAGARATSCRYPPAAPLPPVATRCRPLAPRTPFWRKLRRKRAGWALPLPPANCLTQPIV